MPCPQCGFANADGMNFCGRCGAKLPQGCPACGFVNPSEYTFCGKCGVRLHDIPSASAAAQEVLQHTTLADQPPRAQLPATGTSRLDAERRQLTVLFCDLVDSTALASQLDPEDLREVIRSYQAACADVVQRFDGHIAQYLGDGLLVYFGYPQAHEDDAQRAVRAGLEMANAMQPLNVQLRPRMRALQATPLRVRLGIHTGLVVVGEMGAGGRQEQLALGETPNVAARLQSLAVPDTIVISAATARLVAGYFIVHDLGVQTLKGRRRSKSCCSSCCSYYIVRGELQTSRDLAEEFLHRGQHEQEPALVLVGHFVLGATLFYLGEVTEARSHLERGLALYDPQQRPSLAVRYGYDPRVFCIAYAALALWVLGYPDQALQRGYEDQVLAQEVAHPFSLAGALYFMAWLHQWRRERPTTQAQAEALMALSHEQAFTMRLAGGAILQGWALAEQGQGVEGIEQMHQALTAYRATGAELVQPYFLSLLAEAYGHAGHTAEGLTALTTALAAAHQTGECWWEAELYRLQGELLLAQSAHQTTEAEACFQQALEVARRRQAKSLELRAAMSLGRLWQCQGRRAEAHQLLAEVYGWFTEGFNTTDLQETRALLEELA